MGYSVSVDLAVFEEVHKKHVSVVDPAGGDFMEAVSDEIRQAVRSVISEELAKSTATASNEASSSKSEGLVDMRKVAEIMSVSQRTVWALASREAMPKPIRLGRCVRWPEEEIHAWLKAGCPSGNEWEKVRGRWMGEREAS